MIEETVLQHLSYCSLISLIRDGELKQDEKLQVQKLARSKPLYEKKLYQLMQRREA